MRSSTLSLWLVLAGAVVLPFGLRGLNTLAPAANVSPSFLPSVEAPRMREPFDEESAASFREGRPDFVVIGDSMAGSRIIPGHMSRLIGGRGLAAILHPGSSVAYWYLAFKNFVVDNPPMKAKGVLFFFRDAQLTLAFDRFTPGALDRVARDREPVLDAIVAGNLLGTFSNVHRAVDAAYRADRAREWLGPAFAQAPAKLAVRDQDAAAFLDTLNTKVFTLETLRRTEAADLPEATADMLDFKSMVTRSVLPEMLRLAETSNIRIAFVRVQRRPTASGPVPQSEAMVRYMRDLRDYLAQHGAYFVDEFGDPDLPLAVYGDGDHMAREARIPYNERFFEKNRRFFQ